MIRRMRSLITYVTSLAKDTPPQAYLPHHSTEQFLYRSPSNLCTLTSSVSDGTWIYCPSSSNALRIGKNCCLNDSTTCWSISSISVVVGGPPPVLYRLTYANTCSIQYRLNSNIWHRMLTTELSHTHPHIRTLRHIHTLMYNFATIWLPSKLSIYIRQRFTPHLQYVTTLPIKIRKCNWFLPSLAA